LLKTKALEAAHANPEIAAIAAGVFAILDPATVASVSNGSSKPSVGGATNGDDSSWKKIARTEALR